MLSRFFPIFASTMKYINITNALRHWSLCSVCLATVMTVLLAGCASQRGCYVGVQGGGMVYYEERGKGEPLILLHGHSLDRRMWDTQWRDFSARYHTIRLDFRGYGLSSAMREDLHITHVDDVVALMDSLKIERAHVVGLSMGAFVAGDMLAMYPDRLLSCVLCSGGIRNSKGPSEPMDSAENAKREQEIAALRLRGVEVMKREWTEQLVSGGGSRRETMRKPLHRMISQWTAWQPLHKEPRLFYGKEAWAELRRKAPVSVPLLVLRGETEGKTSRARELDYVKDGEQITLPDCGHMMNMEQPQRFNATVLSFLSKHCKQ